MVDGPCQRRELPPPGVVEALSCETCLPKNNNQPLKNEKHLLSAEFYPPTPMPMLKS